MNFHTQLEASDHGFYGAGGVKTTPFGIQVAVHAVNDVPVVEAPPHRDAVPGEISPLPGFTVMDPDTDTDGKLSEAMQRVSIIESLESGEQTRDGGAFLCGRLHLWWTFSSHSSGLKKRPGLPCASTESQGG